MSSNDVTATGIHAHADFAPGTVLGGRYRIDGILGIGGMGVVYRAHDLSLGIDVALKLLRPELAHRPEVLERFRQELLLARQISSAHVLRIHDIAQHDGHWLISMDYVDGESLDRRLDREGRLPQEDALRIARQVAEGLAAAHAKGVVHRDLKPANVLIDANGDALIADFGVARSLADSGGAGESLTRAGSVIGTPDYLSPEQARGVRADARSDLYALGLILHEMLTGKLPFPRGTMAEVLAQRMLRAPDPIASEFQVPGWATRLVDRLLRAQPAHRLQSAKDVVEAIDRREMRRDLRAWLPRSVLLASAAAVIALAIAGGWIWWRAHPPAATAAVAESARPLDRLLVMPISGSGNAAMDVALTARLRDALTAVPGLAVVDGERTALAFRQSTAGDDSRMQAGDAQKGTGARRVLQAELRQQQGGWALVAHLRTGSEAPRVSTGPLAADPMAALRAWAASADAAQMLALKPGAVQVAAADDTAMRAYGAARIAQESGRLKEALQFFQSATLAAPTDVAAWQAQAKVASMIGENDLAADAVEQGQRVAANAAPSVRQRLAAQRATIDGDPAAAVNIWHGLLQATPDDADTALELARAQAEAGDLKLAIAGLQTLAQRDGNDPRIWYALGKFSILSGQAQRAVDEYLTRALVQFKRSRDLYGQAETVNALGIGYDRLGQGKDAVEQYRKAAELRHALGNQRGEATSLRNLGNALAIEGDHDAAARHLQEARALYEQLNDRAGLAGTENDLGLLAEERGNFPDALLSFKRALIAWQQLQDPQRTAQAQNDLGFAQFQLGAYNDADVYLHQAADGYAKIGDATGQIRTAQNLGLLAIAHGRWDTARQSLERSLAAAEREQMVEEAAVSLRNLSELELWQGHLQKAIAQADKAKASFAARDDARGVADAGLLRVDARLALHDIKAALADLAELQTALRDASSEQRAIAARIRAELALAQGHVGDAEIALKEARKLASDSGVRQLALRIELVAARIAPDPVAALRTLDAPTAQLGNVGLRLEWLRQRLPQLLEKKDVHGAVAAYQEAAGLLRAGDYLHAAELHRLGAQARTLAGDAAGARAAQARAEEAGR